VVDPTERDEGDIPREFANVPPPKPVMLDHSFTLQAVMELQKSVAELAAKADRLISDVSKQSEKIEGVRDQISFVKGAMWVIGIVMAGVLVVVGWYFSGKLSITLKP
jgi:hypothetical protein